MAGLHIMAGVGPSPWRFLWVPATLAVALLLMLLVLPSIRQQLAPLGPGPEITSEGARIALRSPAGPTRPPVEFEWTSPIAAARYVVDIFDSDNRVLLSVETEAEAVDLGEFAPILAPGVSYAWQVTALDEHGDIVLRSPAQTFIVTP